MEGISVSDGHVDPGARIVAVVGIYDADGGIRGELTYVVGHILGRTECALCDVTHSPLRRRPEWNAMVGRLPKPMSVVHRNEASTAELAVAASVGLPVVLATHSDGRHSVLLDRDSLSVLDGSVGRFESALLAALEGGS